MLQSFPEYKGCDKGEGRSAARHQRKAGPNVRLAHQQGGRQPDAPQPVFGQFDLYVLKERAKP